MLRNLRDLRGSFFSVGFEKKDYCPHVVDLKLIKKVRRSIVKEGCKLCKKGSGDNNNWMCCSCAQVSCGRDQKGHAMKHSQESGHLISISLEDFSFWCYKCQKYVVDEKLDKIYGVLHFLKFGAYPTLSYISSPNYELPSSSRRGVFETQVRTPSPVDSMEDRQIRKLQQNINTNPFLNDMRAILKKHKFKYKSYIYLDGNCQFCSVADLIYDDPDKGDSVREFAVDWLKENWKSIKSFLNRDKYSTWKVYLKEMSKDGIWGDQITLYAIAHHYKINISVLSNVIKEGYMSTVKVKKSKRTIHLCLYHNFHYRSIVPDT